MTGKTLKKRLTKQVNYLVALTRELSFRKRLFIAYKILTRKTMRKS